MEALKNKKIQITIGVAVTIIIFIMNTTSQYTSAQNKIEERLCNLEDKMTTIAVTIQSMQEKNHADDMQYTEIKVKLANIETLLQELKQRR
jgi:low affinity Fe/Cu permease